MQVLKRLAVIFCMAASAFVAGCTTDDADEWLNGNYFGIDENVRDNGTQPHANEQGFLLGSFDIKEVTNDPLDDLPEYDFSGPSNYTDGLNSENIKTSNTEVGMENALTVYVVPAHSKTAVIPPLIPVNEDCRISMKIIDGLRNRKGQRKASLTKLRF